MRALLVAALSLTACALVTASCAHAVTTSIRPDQIGTKYARISGYLATRSAAPGGTHTERTPGSIRHDAILDEATLAKVDAGESCVDLVLRTASTYDEPLDQFKPSFAIDGRETRGVIEDETVSVYDYAFTGMRQTASVEGVAANQFIGMSLSQPTEQIFRVIERKGRVCGALGGQPREIKLSITHPSWDVASYNYHLDFGWKLN